MHFGGEGPRAREKGRERKGERARRTKDAIKQSRPRRNSEESRAEQRENRANAFQTFLGLNGLVIGYRS